MRRCQTGLRVLMAAAVLAGCGWDGLRERPHRNEPPTVRITGGVSEGGTTCYRTGFLWTGSDADGVIDHFLTAIDDTVTADGASAWSHVDGFEASYLLEASGPGDPRDHPATASSWHRFFLKAVDDDGAASRTATRYFDATTIAPTARLLYPHGQGAEKIARITRHHSVRWTGRDEDASGFEPVPVGYQVKLVRIDDPFTVHDEQVIRWLVHPIVRRKNVFIPPELARPDTTDIPADSASILYHETDWYPKREAPLTGRQLQLPDIRWGAYAFAVRAVDEANGRHARRGAGAVRWREPRGRGQSSTSTTCRPGRKSTSPGPGAGPSSSNGTRKRMTVIAEEPKRVHVDGGCLLVRRGRRDELRLRSSRSGLRHVHGA